MKVGAYRSALGKELQAIDLRLRALEEPTPSVQGDDADQSLALANQEELVLERERLLEKRWACQSAMLRIEEKSYGACISCTEPIGDERLRALPWTPRCIACENAHERETRGQPLDMLPGDAGHGQ